jgi:hypothetical protein
MLSGNKIKKTRQVGKYIKIVAFSCDISAGIPVTRKKNLALPQAVASVDRYVIV